MGDRSAGPASQTPATSVADGPTRPVANEPQALTGGTTRPAPEAPQVVTEGPTSSVTEAPNAVTADGDAPKASARGVETGSTVPVTTIPLGLADIPLGVGGRPIAGSPQLLPMCNKVHSYLEAGQRFTASFVEPSSGPDSVASAGQQLVDALNQVAVAAPEGAGATMQAMATTMSPVVVAMGQARSRSAVVDLVRTYIGDSKAQLDSAFDVMVWACPGEFPMSPKLPNIADGIRN